MRQEQIPISEEISHVGLDDYLSYVSSLDEINGEIPQTAMHGFFLWHAMAYPEFKVEGYSMPEIYLHNVLEGEMTEERFALWCDDFKLPYTYFLSSKERTDYGIAYMQWYEAETLKILAKYEEWAEKHGIDTRPGAIMKFIDVEGNEYRVRTEANRRGEIIVGASQ